MVCWNLILQIVMASLGNDILKTFFDMPSGQRWENLLIGYVFALGFRMLHYVLLVKNIGKFGDSKMEQVTISPSSMTTQVFRPKQPRKIL